MENVIVLNADMTYHQTVHWQDAVCMMLKGVAEPVKEGTKVVRSISLEIIVPKVLRLVRYVFIKYDKRAISFQRKTVYLRDNYTCQYCGKKLKKQDCTLDHVLPKVKGGKSSYTNCVTACVSCNLKKGSKTTMKPKAPPKDVTPHLFMKLKTKDSIKLIDGFNSV